MLCAASLTVFPDSSSWQKTVEIKSETWRGAPGAYRVGQCRAGRWWWVNPAGVPGVVCGVQGVRRTSGGAEGHGVLAQLDAWGFNLLGVGVAPEFAGHGVPHLEVLDLRRVDEAPIRVGGAFLPDVFDPRWTERCAARVAAVNAGRDLAGYVSDTALAWAQPPASGAPPPRPTLLQLCLSLDPRFAAYHAAWEFVLAPYGGEFATMSRVWALPVPNREALRQMTLEEEPLTSPGYLADQARFTREFAQRYFRGAAAAVRQADPGRLFFGAPVHPTDAAEIREAALAQVDVLLVQDSPPALAGGPVLVVDFEWTPAADEPADDEPIGWSRLERMHQRGRAALDSVLRHPSTIGYTWAAYAAGDRVQDAPFARGLVYEDGGVAHEHVQVLGALNAAAGTLHAAGPRRASPSAG